MPQLTSKQLEAQRYCAGPASNVMLFGGSRSGKTFLHVRNVVMRALKAPNSRHAIFRFRANHLKASIFLDTLPKVLRIMFPGVPWTPHTQDMYITLGDGSEIWFAGLDDKERTEKILGMEFATVYFNECSQIPYGSIATAMTRLAQRATTKMEGRDDSILKTRAWFDCNPPNQSHWTYQLFKLKRDPSTKKSVANPEDYESFQMNPRDNMENLSPEYLKTLETLPANMRKRFLEGNFADANPNALFPEENIDKWRVLDGVIPDMVRIVVAVDPSGADDVDNADNDAIGIVVAGLGTDGNAYVLEDCTVKAGPGTWGRIVTSAFDRHEADCVVGETNYGGAMVQQTIQVARARTPFKKVTASRGKVVRAEPFSALYEAGKVRHVGLYPELEDELSGFSTFGFTGNGSPNRADALVWALAELFPGIVRKKGEKKDVEPAVHQHASHSAGWMR